MSTFDACVAMLREMDEDALQKVESYIRFITWESAETEDPFYSEVNMARLRKAARRMAEGKGTEHELIEVADDAENLG